MKNKRESFYKKIAKERIRILLNLAFEKVRENKLEIARKYIKLLRRIALKTNFRLKKIKRLFCRKCNIPLVIGVTARVRLNKKNKTINVSCLQCGFIKRYPYKPKLSRRPS